VTVLQTSGRILTVVALGITISVASPSTAQPVTNSEKFPCNNKNSKAQTPEDPSSKHTVALTWNPSVSLSTPPGSGEGYKVYRLNPDGSCTKLNLYVFKPNGSYEKVNDDLIRATVLEDWFVEADKIYRYGATAVKQNSESGVSNVADVKIPPL
jgi:hypothetical protein